MLCVETRVDPCANPSLSKRERKPQQPNRDRSLKRCPEKQVAQEIQSIVAELGAIKLFMGVL
jgi:hypothetical protein